MREAAYGSCGRNWQLCSAFVVREAASGSCGLRTGNFVVREVGAAAVASELLTAASEESAFA